VSFDLQLLTLASPQTVSELTDACCHKDDVIAKLQQALENATRDVNAISSLFSSIRLFLSLISCSNCCCCLLEDRRRGGGGGGEQETPARGCRGQRGERRTGQEERYKKEEEVSG